MNDIVVLPIVLVLIALLTEKLGGTLDWLRFLGQVLLLSPLVGLVVGGGGAWLIGKADARFGIRTEHQALYGIGLVLFAFVAGQAVGGDGFLAAFFAGLAVNIFNVTLCDCFMEYGEITSEMAMLLAFVLFGAVLSSLFSTMPLVAPFVLALFTILVARPAALMLVLQRATMSNLARGFIGWFGPRGLSSLLLVLLAVQANAPDAERLLAITGVVVVVSTIAHGASATPLSAWYGRRVAGAQVTLAEEREATATGLFSAEAATIARMLPTELAAALQGPNPPIVLDVRTRGQYEQHPDQIPSSVRVLPDQIEAWAATHTKEHLVVAYCT